MKRGNCDEKRPEEKGRVMMRGLARRAERLIQKETTGKERNKRKGARKSEVIERHLKKVAASQPSTLCAVKFEKDHGENCVKKLIEPYYRSGRNVTFDNVFTTLKLIQHLLRQGLTCVGTVRKDKKFIQEPLRHHSFSKDKQYTSRFAFQEKATMVSYKSKKNKVVTLLSSMHSDKAVSEDEKKKPDIVAFYNSTKGGVDGMDQKVHKYSCKRKSHKWPMAYFFNIVDVACLAAHVVFKTKFPDHPLSGKDSRSHFIRSVASGPSSTVQETGNSNTVPLLEGDNLHFYCQLGPEQINKTN
ncbi:PiggyBac transposable element-derived protein 4 [Plakobranchus ocellatus]|uniref:PiggyBac transposable element-derived protein 4 n=1 Tax=Plakobranchus ocellatus TaxID=259542 RepID=A0AAV3YMH2_9GAST|nr:PiggyBac transposable element-derived protein 4 [Plakobranchus ocellatus]